MARKKFESSDDDGVALKETTLHVIISITTVCSELFGVSVTQRKNLAIVRHGVDAIASAVEPIDMKAIGL